MKIHFIFLFIISLFPLFTQSQVEVYLTSDDYKNNSGITYDSFSNTKAVSWVTFKKGSVETEYSCKDIWGFKVDGELWRTFDYPGTPSTYAKLLVDGNGEGPLYYYEYGGPYAATIQGKTSYVFNKYESYISNSITGDLILIYTKGGPKKKLKKYMEENPELKSFIECILENGSQSNYYARICTKSFYKEKGIEDIEFIKL